jgi:hypothetical protein
LTSTGIFPTSNHQQKPKISPLQVSHHIAKNTQIIYHRRSTSATEMMPTEYNLSGNKRDTTATPSRSTRRSSRNKDGVSFGTGDASAASGANAAASSSILKNRDEVPSVSSPEKKKRKSSKKGKDKTSSPTRCRSKTPTCSRSRSKSKEPSKPKERSVSKGRKKDPPEPATSKETPKSTKNVVQGVITVKKMDNLRQYVYGKYGNMLSTFQRIHGAKDTRIACYLDKDRAPLLSTAKMPTDHVKVEQFFYSPGGARQWYGPGIPANKTRKITFCFLLESNVPIEDMVDMVAVDMMDHHIILEYKTCQCISHESSLHLVRVYNKFSRPSVEKALQQQLANVQMEEYRRDKTSFLGSLQHKKIVFPKISVQKDYPFNGPFKKEADGADTTFKKQWTILYDTKYKEQVEAAVKIFKDSGALSRYWGEHANIHHAPPKTEETSETKLNEWHRICNGHSGTMLSMGMIKFEDIIDPDYPVKVEYWKSSPSKRPTIMTLRDIFHSIQVPGSKGPVQVLHGMCRSPNGGYELAVADTIPTARTLARNIAHHPAGWVLGYITQLKWKKDCIAKLMTKSFTASAVMEAERSKWDKKTGEVKGATSSAVDEELANLENSWVDMSLITSSKEITEEEAVFNATSTARFNWEEGASVKTLSSKKEDSDTDGSLLGVDSSDEEEESYSGSEDDEGSGSGSSGSSSGSKNNSESDAEDSVEEKRDVESLSVKSLNSGLSWDDSDEEMNDPFATADLKDKLEIPIRKLFPEDPGMIDLLLTLATNEAVPDEVLAMYDEYNVYYEKEETLYNKQAKLLDRGQDSGDDMEQLEYLYQENRVNKEEAEIRLRKALEELAEESQNVGSAQQQPLAGFQSTTEGAVMDEDPTETIENSQGNAGHASG